MFLPGSKLPPPTTSALAVLSSTVRAEFTRVNKFIKFYGKLDEFCGGDPI
jgi:hypothetical protein